MSAIVLSPEDETELYVLLKPAEEELEGPLAALLQRIEKSLFQRSTIEEIERLTMRFSSKR